MRQWPCIRLLGLLLLCGLPPHCPAGATEDAENNVIELYKSGKLFDKAQYKAVRAAYAQPFEARHEDLIRQAYGGTATS